MSDDIGINITNITIQEAPNRFVPLLGDNKGLLPAKVKVTGEDGMPGSATIQVRHRNAGYDLLLPQLSDRTATGFSLFCMVVQAAVVSDSRLLFASADEQLLAVLPA